MTTATQLRAQIKLQAIRSNIEDLISDMQDCAVLLPPTERAAMESAADDARYIEQTVVAPILAGRKPHMAVIYAENPLAREEALDTHPRVIAIARQQNEAAE